MVNPALQTTSPDRQHLHLLDGLTFRPVFIIGDHRSGTTLLYQLLASTQRLNIVTAYHVIKYDEILNNHLNRRTPEAKRELEQAFAQAGLTNRLLDGVRVTPDLPEEYGFVISPSRRPQLTKATLPRFMELCRKVQFSSDQAKPLLLKNPWDVLQFAGIKQMFPESRFVFIHRHPVSVINSQLLAFRSMMASRNAYIAMLAPWYRELFQRPRQVSAERWLLSSFHLSEKIVARHVALVADYFLKNIDSVPKTDYLPIRYEDLCAEPDRIMGQVIEFLGVQPEPSVSFKSFIRPRASEPLPEARSAFERIRGPLSSYLTIHGYDVNGSAAGQ